MSHKPKRGAPAIDMTAMVDVAFLLLTFFILTTTKFREETAVEIDTPGSISITSVPATDLMVIEVDNEGKVYAGFSDIDIREEALRIALSEEKNNLKLTEEQVKVFASQQNFGSPIAAFNQVLGALAKGEKVIQPGLPITETDSVTHAGNELRDWVRYGRTAVARRNLELPQDLKKTLRFAIKADGKAEYKKIKEVINTLQDWNINQFSLITALEEPPTDFVPSEKDAKSRVGF